MGVKSAVVKSVVEKPADVKVETTPITYTVPAVHHPVVYNTAVHHPVVYNAAVAPVVAPVASHTITNYNNPEQYTAVSNGVFGPSYVAKNGPVEHIVKREAEADPALLESTLPPLSSLTPLSRPLTTLLPPPPSDTLTLPTSVSAPTLTVSRSPVNYHHHSILHQDSYLV